MPDDYTEEQEIVNVLMEGGNGATIGSGITLRRATGITRGQISRGDAEDVREANAITHSPKANRNAEKRS